MTSRSASPSLQTLARSVRMLLEAVRLKFREPKAATPSRLPRKLPDLRGPLRTAAVRLCDATDEAVWAAEELDRFSFPADEELARMSARLRDAACGLEKALALFSKPERAQELLIEAKKHASEAERLHRKQRAFARDDPKAVDGLKREAIAKRLSDSAEHLQRAIDAAAEALAL